MKRISIVVAIVQVVFLGGTTLLAQDSVADWSEVKGEKYTIMLPSDWEVKKMGDVGINLVAMAPLDSDGDAFRENLTLVKEKLDGNVDLKTFALESSKPVLESLEESNVSVSQLIPTKSGPYYEMIYSAKQNDMVLRYSQYYFVSNGFAYIITLAGEYSKHKKYEAQFDRIATDFKLN